MDDELIKEKAAKVKKIAKKCGYPDYIADDLSQDVALKTITTKNFKQKNYYSFVDAVRRLENKFTRNNKETGCVVSSELVNCILNKQIKEEIEYDNREEFVINIYNLASSLYELNKRNFIVFICYHIYGLSLEEISKFERVDSSRISQLLKFSREQIKKEIIQGSLLQEKQRKRKQKEFRLLQQELQNKRRIKTEKERTVEKIFAKKGDRLGSFEVKKVPTEVFRSF